MPFPHTPLEDIEEYAFSPYSQPGSLPPSSASQHRRTSSAPNPFSNPNPNPNSGSPHYDEAQLSPHSTHASTLHRATSAPGDEISPYSQSRATFENTILNQRETEAYDPTTWLASHYLPSRGNSTASEYYLPPNEHSPSLSYHPSEVVPSPDVSSYSPQIHSVSQGPSPVSVAAPTFGNPSITSLHPSAPSVPAPTPAPTPSAAAAYSHSYTSYHGTGPRPPFTHAPQSATSGHSAQSYNSVTGLIMASHQQQNPFDSPGDNDNDRLGVAPRIHVNSIPNSPTSEADIATFSGNAGYPSPAGPPPTQDPFAGGTSYPTSYPSVPSPVGASYSEKPQASSSGVDARAGAGAVSTAASRRAARTKGAASIRSGRSGRSRATNGGQGPDSKRKPFQSTRLKGEIYKPWLEKKDPAQRWARWITIVSIFLGFAAAGLICYDGYRSVPSLGKTCMILNDDFQWLDTSIWTHEVRLDGYGNGEFEWTTASTNNSFVEDGVLYLVPTLTSDVLGESAITNGYTLNLTTDGTCTSKNVTQCGAVSNSSLLHVINPVQSARLTTVNSMSLKYGKVEVKARFPTGDWLWPSITMLPVNETYGAWPRSGQIDIVTGRGNNASYENRGVDYAQSDLHWGPTTDLDRLYMTWGYREERRVYYDQEFHTFGLEWNEDFLWTYIDSRVSQVISLRFNKESFWTRGYFPPTITNNSVVEKLTNPWAASGDNVAPFDQPFYLIIDLAVGGTSGWFPDGEGGKPWLDDSPSAMSDFWAAKNKWYPTWPTDVKQRGFAIESVKVWKTC